MKVCVNKIDKAVKEEHKIKIFENKIVFINLKIILIQ